MKHYVITKSGKLEEYSATMDRYITPETRAALLRLYIKEQEKKQKSDNTRR